MTNATALPKTGTSDQVPWNSLFAFAYAGKKSGLFLKLPHTRHEAEGRLRDLIRSYMRESTGSEPTVDINDPSFLAQSGDMLAIIESAHLLYDPDFRDCGYAQPQVAQNISVPQQATFSRAGHFERIFKKERIGTVCVDLPLANLDLIEPRIRLLIESLNASGRYTTIASCQGHLTFGCRLMPWNIPYVLFEASQRRYLWLWEHFQPGARPRDDFKLHWRPSLSFHPIGNKGLVMALHGYPKSYFVSRADIDSDLNALREFLPRDIQ